MLPGSVPVRALEFPEWDLRFIVQARDVFHMRGESLQRSRTDLIRVLHKRLRLVRGGYPLSSVFCLEKWTLRSYGESMYDENLK